MKSKRLDQLRRGDRVFLAGVELTVQHVGTAGPSGLVRVTYRDGSYTQGHQSNTVPVREVAA